MARRTGTRPGTWVGHATIGTVLALVLAAACGGCSTASKPAVRLSSCTVQGVEAQCGTFKVPENRRSGTGRRIGLRVVVVPARGADPRPDPIVYVAGGPGDAATQHVRDMVAVRGERDRDLLFVDQRGTGGSHRLVCPSPAPATGGGGTPGLASYVAACLHGLDGDARFYTSAMAADDLADVLRALGHDRANLYGASYGATIAQVFERRHPRMVRTMTLLGGTLLDVPIFERLPGNSQGALGDVFARCRADAACTAAFPQLDAEWRRLLADLRARPVTVPADRSPTGRRLVLTSQLFAGAVHQLLLSADTAARLPWLVHTLATAPDRAAAVAAVIARFGDVLAEDDTFLIMRYAIRCTEAWARFRPAAVAAGGRDSYYRDTAVANARYWQEACAAFPPSARGAADIPAPTVSQTPVLLINGSADPQDPPSNARGAERRWPHSLRLVEPHQSHSVSQWRCHESLVDAFIERGDVKGLDTHCLAAVLAPAFATS